MRMDTFTYCTNKERYFQEIREPSFLYGQVVRRIRVQPACRCIQKKTQNGLFLLLACEAGEGDHSRRYRDLALRCAERSLKRYLARQCALEDAIEEMAGDWRQSFREREPLGTYSKMERMAPSSFLALVGSERKVAALYCSDWQVACISNGAYDPFLRADEYAMRGFSRRNEILFCVLRDPIPDAIVLLTREDVEQEVILPALDALQKSIWKNRALSADTVEQVMERSLREFREQGVEVGVIGYWSDKRKERAARDANAAANPPGRPPMRTAPSGAPQQRQQPTNQPGPGAQIPSWLREKRRKQLQEAQEGLEQARRELSAARERRAQMEKQLGYLEQDYRRKRENREKMKGYLDRKASYLEQKDRSDTGENGEGGTP